MKPIGYGKKKLGYPRIESFVWAKKITSGPWEIPGLVVHARKFLLTKVSLWDVTARTVVQHATVIDI